ncbi:hypothetical protein ACS8E9_17335 [Pseudomonas neustonica]|uniref:hypothetical protein n=1 Tax=Pseudomonas neustonica TaxID=2487346 RepID=UPI003F45EF76|nr:hypothetical protein [Halopseudomonas aestusnigri]|tara:strand:- start:12615 stop:12860 length:246 start_codon:yes stop_codon:yes gene_type:complete
MFLVIINSADGSRYSGIGDTPEKAVTDLINLLQPHRLTITSSTTKVMVRHKTNGAFTPLEGPDLLDAIARVSDTYKSLKHD